MDTNYISNLPIELRTIILDFLSPDDIKALCSEINKLGFVDILKDYWYFFNRLKRDHHQLDTVRYIIGETLFPNYFKLNDILNSQRMKNLIRYPNPKRGSVLVNMIEFYIYYIPFEYLNNKIKELLSDYYIKSLCQQDIKNKTNNKSLLDYSISLWKTSKLTNYFEIIDGNNTMRYLLNKDEVYNIIALILYMEIPLIHIEKRIHGQNLYNE